MTRQSKNDKGDKQDKSPPILQSLPRRSRPCGDTAQIAVSLRVLSMSISHLTPTSSDVCGIQ